MNSGIRLLLCRSSFLSVSGKFIFMFMIYTTIAVFVSLVAFLQSNGLVKKGEIEDPKVFLENFLLTRHQYDNFEASLIVERTSGDLFEMPAKMQYDYRFDERNGRYRLRRKPLVEIELSKESQQLKGRQSDWLETRTVFRDHLWGFAFEGNLALSRQFIGNSRLSYCVHTLGFGFLPREDWTLDSIASCRGVLGLNDNQNQFRFRPDTKTVDGVILEGIECIHPDGKIRTAWVDRATMRIYRLEIPYSILSERLKPEEDGTITIQSRYDTSNDSVIPDNVVIQETINGKNTIGIEIKLVKFERDKQFLDDDFSYSDLGLRINGNVTDLDTRAFLGYWNGRNWSSRTPVSGGNIVSAAIEMSERQRKEFGWFRFVAISSSALAGILLTVWLLRRFRKSE
jgi:hypothetical protein